MAKHKTVTHLPAPPSPPAPRLVGQLLTAAGELVIVAAAALGIVTAAGWLVVGYDRSRATRHPPAPRPDLICWVDRRYGEMCAPEDRPPVRRHYVRD